MLKCNRCGVLFKTVAEIEKHAKRVGEKGVIATLEPDGEIEASSDMASERTEK
jgi:hypothetical protein